MILAVIQAKTMTMVLGSFGPANTAQEMVHVSLRAEATCLDAIQSILDILKRTGALTPGTSNLLEGVADKHETFVYLLRQRAHGEGYTYDRG